MNRLSKSDVERILSLRFANETYKRLNDLPSPFLFLDMQKAVDRIANAIKSGELITIIGDYDVDGVVATAIVVEFLESVGARFEYIIPNRFRDGYGVSLNVLKRAKGTLIITVDNGISATEGAKVCKQNGIDLIITDHHTPQDELPEAYAIINPKQQKCSFPVQEICGAQVAWYLVAAIKSAIGAEYNLKNALDILAIAVIADVMPLVEINRSLVRHGLIALESSSRPAISVLKSALNRDRFLSEDIAFLLAPKLNSAGRMDDAEVALRFLLSGTKNDAEALYSNLISFNESRKLEENAIFEEANASVDPNDDVIVVWSKEWHEGVIGIVSARLMEQFEKPSIVISIKEHHAKGSARSPEGIDIFRLISTQKELLLGFGGHKCAAGLSLDVKNLQAFRSGINRAYKEHKDKLCEPINDESVLGEISLNEIDIELLNILGRYEPYGEGNPKPIFASEQLCVKECRSVGEAKHTYLVLQELRTKTIKRAIAYKKQYELREKDVIKCDFLVSKNEFNNIIEPKVVIRNLYK